MKTTLIFVVPPLRTSTSTIWVLLFIIQCLDLIYNPSAPNIISKNWFKFSFKLVTEYSSFEHCQSCSWQRREGGNTNPVNLFLSKFFPIKTSFDYWFANRRATNYMFGIIFNGKCMSELCFWGENNSYKMKTSQELECCPGHYLIVNQFFV